MERRDFVTLCAASAAGVSLPTAGQGSVLSARMYKRVKLLGADSRPLRIASLRKGVNYVFEYPYEATPCFLLSLEKPARLTVDLRTESGFSYRWDGGIGADQSVVAYSAICAHKMTYPTKQVSFIGYRPEPSPVAGAGKVITCCSDRSVYDPAAGARVVSGPAPQPLATILLEHDAKADEVYAVGTFGGEMFLEFFKKYEFRLQLEMGGRAKAVVERSVVVRELANYSAQWARC